MQQQLHFYEVLLRRAKCPPSQLATLQSKYHTTLAGFTGEKRVLFELNELQLPHSVIHNFISFNNANHKVQIDVLLICTHFVLVLEAKNISGRIDFDDRRRQLIRTRLNGEQESFMNPIDQVKRHQQYVEQLFLSGSEFVPVESAVVIANPNTLIGRVSNEVPVFNVSGLRNFVQGLCKKYSHVQLNTRRIQQLLKSLCVEEKFDLSAENYDIRRGVLCLKCDDVMRLCARGFKCFKCGVVDVDHAALLRTLQDYRVLYGREITNKAFREFCLVDCRKTAHKYLIKLNFPHIGNNKGRKYFIDK